MPSKWSKVIKDSSNGVAIENWEAIDLEAERLAKEQAEKEKEPPHDCSQLQQEAFEAGRQAGLEEGKKPAKIELQRALSLVAQTEQIRLETARQSEFNTVELALAISKKVIHREASLDAGILVEQVRRLVQTIAEKGLIIVRVHPSEMAHLQTYRAFVLGADGQPARLSLESDESIHPGGCIVESSQYFIDATVESQLEKIWQEMIKPDVEPPNPNPNPNPNPLLLHRLDRINPISIDGRVSRAVGLTIEGTGPVSSIGQACRIITNDCETGVEAEVIGFRDDRVLVMPLGEVRGIGPGSRLLYEDRTPSIGVSPSLLGRIFDGMGRPIDGKGPVPSLEAYPLYSPSLNPLDRQRIAQPLDLGVRAINALLTCGRGQKVGIFAGSGIGKSVLLGMMCRHTAADVTVLGLIGERGREVKEFIEKEIGEEGLRRTVVVAATSDQPPLVRLRGAFIATAIAEYFRDQGKDVLLLMDSLTRVAHAQREVGLAAGEPPTSKGYPPSVFAVLPRILERVGPIDRGSLTGLYTVLVEGDDLSDPVADFIRAILDGHIVLSRELASRGHFPAIDIVQSISRVMPDIAESTHISAARAILDILATHRNAEDLINLGAYRTGTNPRLDIAVTMMEHLRPFLQQEVTDRADLASSLQCLENLITRAQEMGKNFMDGRQ